MNEYSTQELVRWMQRLEDAINDLTTQQRDNRQYILRWVLGILSAIIIFGVTGLIKAFLS